MKNKLSTACAVVGAGIVLALTGGAAPVTVTDNFNNNAVNQSLWDIHQFGGVALAETSQRLQFTAGGTGALSFAGLEVENWGAKWKNDFQIEFDYKLVHGNPPGNRAIFLGVGLTLVGQWPQTITGVACGLLQNNDGLFLGWIKYENGVQVDFDGIAIPHTSGRVTLKWDKSEDKLTVQHLTHEVELNGLFAEHGVLFGNDPMVISIGCATTDGNITAVGSKTYVDDFEFHGVKRQR